MPMPDTWQRVRRLKGATLATLHHAKPFVVLAVDDDRVRIMTRDGKGGERSVPRDQIERIAALRLRREEFRQRTAEEFPNSQNTSYIAAIAFEAGRVGS